MNYYTLKPFIPLRGKWRHSTLSKEGFIGFHGLNRDIDNTSFECNVKLVNPIKVGSSEISEIHVHANGDASETSGYYLHDENRKAGAPQDQWLPDGTNQDAGCWVTEYNGEEVGIVQLQYTVKLPNDFNLKYSDDLRTISPVLTTEDLTRVEISVEWPEDQAIPLSFGVNETYTARDNMPLYFMVFKDRIPEFWVNNNSQLDGGQVGRALIYPKSSEFSQDGWSLGYFGGGAFVWRVNSQAFTPPSISVTYTSNGSTGYITANVLKTFNYDITQPWSSLGYIFYSASGVQVAPDLYIANAWPTAFTPEQVGTISSDTVWFVVTDSYTPTKTGYPYYEN